MQPNTQATAERPLQAFLNRLRARTSASHTALEAHPLSQAISASSVGRESYVRYLHVMQRVTAGMEESLFPRLEGTVPDLEQRRKQSLLAQDLNDLQAEANPFPTFRLLDGPYSGAYALGAFYVLEGSTLGGRVILKNLSSDLRVDPQQGARYFAGYGAETGRYWQRYLQLLGCEADGPGNAEEIIEGAEQAFLRIIDYFNLCVAYEAEGHCQP